MGRTWAVLHFMRRGAQRNWQKSSGRILERIKEKLKKIQI